MVTMLSLFFTISSNMLSKSNLLSLSVLLWVTLSLISNLSMDFLEGGFISSSYSTWLMIMSVFVLYFIFVFSNDLITVILFNILGLNTMMFFFSTNMIVFYVVFEFALVPMVMLILLRGYQPERIGASLWFVLYTIIGSLPLLFIFLSQSNNQCSLFIMFPSLLSSYMLLFPLGLAFLVKLPVFGFHLWLPKAHVQAPVSGSMFLAAVLLKMGGYGLFFVKPMIHTGGWAPMTILLISVLGSALAMFFCMMLDDLKQVIAYSSIGHMGLVVGTILADNEMGILSSLLIMVGHGFTSSLMFYLGNETYIISGSRSLSLTKGMISISPALSLMLGSVLVLNMSFPPSINVFGEMSAIMSMVGAFPSSIFLVLMLVLLGGLFNMKLYVSVSHGMNSTGSPSFSLKVAPKMVSVIHLLPYLLLPAMITSV